MELDPDNPVVRLCAEGMRAEMEDRPQDAADCFARAWEARSDDVEACIAAHYVARHQSAPEEALRWNERALALADAVADARVAGFYPSLYLNVGASHERLGDPVEARRWFERAAAVLDTVATDSDGDDAYGAVVRRGVAAGLDRTAPGSATPPPATPSAGARR